MYGDLKKSWWTLALRGALAIVFGLLCYFVPGITLLYLVLLFGIYLIVDGVLTVAAATLWQSDHPWWVLLVKGIVAIAAGTLTLVYPRITAVGLLIIIGVWAIMSGIFEISAATRLRRDRSGEWTLALSGVISILFGAYLLHSPAVGAVAVVFVIGTYAIFFGVLVLVAGLRLRSILHRLDEHAKAFDKAA